MKKKIDTKSNLNANVLNDLCTVFGFDFDVFMGSTYFWHIAIANPFGLHFKPGIRLSHPLKSQNKRENVSGARRKIKLRGGRQFFAVHVAGRWPPEQ